MLLALGYAWVQHTRLLALGCEGCDCHQVTPGDGWDPSFCVALLGASGWVKWTHKLACWLQVGLGNDTVGCPGPFAKATEHGAGLLLPQIAAQHGTLCDCCGKFVCHKQISHCPCSVQNAAMADTASGGRQQYAHTHGGALLWQ